MFQPQSIQRYQPPAASSSARPFLKWIGGKSQLLQTLDQHLPSHFEQSIDTYIEPFLGGGAFFFHVAQKYTLQRFILSDTNADLVAAYWTVQRKVESLLDMLCQLQDQYLKLDESNRSLFYYSIRDRFNSSTNQGLSTKLNHKSIERTAQLIFLNKTCFNGLFRVNSAGKFNASFGKYENPKICDQENLLQVSRVLSSAEIYLCDFAESSKYASPRSFVYLDPPYRPISHTSNFTSYSSTTFTDLDQERLASFCSALANSGCRIMMSNSDPTNTDASDRYFHERYSQFHIVTTEANRMVNCKADRRGKIRELLLMNY